MPSSHVSLRRLSEVFRFPRCGARCAVRTWKYCALFPLSSYLAVTSSVWMLSVDYTFGILREMLLLRRLLEEFHTFSLAQWARILTFSWSPCSCRMEKCAQSMLHSCVVDLVVPSATQTTASMAQVKVSVISCTARTTTTQQQQQQQQQQIIQSGEAPF